MKNLRKIPDELSVVPKSELDAAQKQLELERSRSAKAIEARDAYAKAMAIALKNGIFANKEQVKREIEALVELAKEQG